MKMEQAKHMLETGDHGTVDIPFDVEREPEPRVATRKLVIGCVFLLLLAALAMRVVDRHFGSEHTCDDPICAANKLSNGLIVCGARLQNAQHERATR